MNTKPIPAGSRPLGRFAVTTDPEKVAAFRKALGDAADNGDADTVPTTFPITWIAAPELAERLSVLYAAIGDGKKLVLQTEQSFAYAGPLCLGQNYHLSLDFETVSDGDSYRLVGSVEDEAGAHVLDMTSTFLFVPLPDAAEDTAGPA